MNFDPAPNMSPFVRAHIWDAACSAAREDFQTESRLEKEETLLNRGWKKSRFEEDHWYCDYVFNGPASFLPGEPPSLPMGEAYLLARTMFYVENLSWAAGYDKCRGVLPED